MDPAKERGGVTTPPDRLTAEEQLVWRSLGRAVLRLPRIVDEAMMRTTGLTMTEFAVLDTLQEAEHRTLRISEVAANTGLSSSRVSRVVDSLATRGWCRREPDTTDRRAALAVLTEEGNTKAETAKPHHSRLAREHVLAHIPAEERAHFIAALTAISGGDGS
ncbi:MarR family winged helix-turn-helix transcriptional regulator [Amycolatopsis sp. GM8]|uniref:MarR family winged helix-turn-helix transcriptional regulator n=1 Tax=Amycolatopsis sp. GM8 TaxID=2896530 RepID=UPI001EFFDAB5|nr:MarR family transcriptional regulator [Amycolatopsis sp. GM8]